MSTEETIKPQLSNDMRHTIISKYCRGKPVVTISLELELPYQTVYSVVSVYNKTGRIEALPTRTGRSKILDEECVDFIKEKINGDVSITLQALKACLEVEKNIIASTSTIDRAISSFNFSFKRLQLIPEARNSSENIERRFNYANFYLAQDEDRVIFLDEFGCSCSIRAAYGRSEVGTTPRKNIRAIRSKNYSVSAAVSKNELIYYKTIEGAYNGERYTTFIAEILSILESKCLRNRIFIMDNCTIHKVQTVRPLIESSGHFLFFLPPYSPQLTAIEEVFSQWKSVIKSRNPNTVTELSAAIEQGFTAVTPSDCSNYFRHVREFAIKALRRDPF